MHQYDIHIHIHTHTQMKDHPKHERSTSDVLHPKQIP